ncbi:PTS lactose/cellobiose transporter subunit IIA [Collinsella sp. An2]|uniref:PTS lactose/cellobiose transporter subunit IIA n=1 Tax=Collinsella sp. An2 TaxID=1965585 RepID=UPI001EF4EDA0|nr:PTS lactose/cellobiose transporter subunit IIA [Collinsella sp. An2]
MADATVDINMVAMEVILNAGDGRACIDQALESMAQLDFDAVEAHLAEAETKIQKAHNAQTDTIQRQAAGEDVEYSLLFTHAQDTLMTISAELHMTQKMLPVVRALAGK